jgi:aspartate/methionine/tyrosine aminotransferase
MRLSPRTLLQIDSPIDTTYALLDGLETKDGLLDLAQAAPRYPAAPAVIEHIVTVARDAHGGDYVRVPGLPKLQASVASELSRDYRGRVGEEQVFITAGCNQAFCLVASALAAAGEEIILALPYYFNHDMWLRLEGIVPVYLEPGPDLKPDLDQAGKLITSRTRAIVLVSPGNPSGVTLSPDEIAGFASLANRHGIALILDETYRSFRGTGEPAHRLFADPGWPETVVSLHSFSKDLAIPGYRVGAIVASPALNREVGKLADCVAICAPRIGQEAAWAGLTQARPWREERAAEVAGKRARLEAVMADRPGGFELLSSGGFFGWIRHPFAGRHTTGIVRDLVTGYGTLVIPGTAFLPDDRATFRVSFGNLDHAGLADFAGRLSAAGRSPRLAGEHGVDDDRVVQ